MPAHVALMRDFANLQVASRGKGWSGRTAAGIAARRRDLKSAFSLRLHGEAETAAVRRAGSSTAMWPDRCSVV